VPSFEQGLENKYILELISALEDHSDVIQCANNISSDIPSNLNLRSVSFVQEEPSTAGDYWTDWVRTQKGISVLC
jgi:hypothetical protein